MTETTWMAGWERRSASSAEIIERRDAPVAHSRVFERLQEILGYDVREQQLLMEGYHELAQESLALAEGTIVAGVEALPPEEPEE